MDTQLPQWETKQSTEAGWCTPLTKANSLHFSDNWMQDHQNAKFVWTFKGEIDIFFHLLLVQIMWKISKNDKYFKPWAYKQIYIVFSV